MNTRIDCLIIGAGPAGLMAADTVSSAGQSVMLVDRMPSFGRKFLMAGKSGLNLTHAKTSDPFWSAYPDPHPSLIKALQNFGPKEVCDLATSLGQELFIGSSGRVFPKQMKASPFLRAWLSKLQSQGTQFETKTEWVGSKGTDHHFQRGDQTFQLKSRSVIFAMGGASWSRLGSNGAWRMPIMDLGAKVPPFQPSNVALNLQWSHHLSPFFGKPLKSVIFFVNDMAMPGEAVLTKSGLEGSAIYSASIYLRKNPTLFVSFLPQNPPETIKEKWYGLPRKLSTSNRLRRLGLSATQIAFFFELQKQNPNQDIPQLLYRSPIKTWEFSNLERAISTAGGVSFESLNPDLSLKGQEGAFAAGEMLNWDAPTGGYLLTACFATGHLAGQSALNFLNEYR